MAINSATRQNWWLTAVNLLLGVVMVLSLALWCGQADWLTQLCAYLCAIGFSVGSAVALLAGRQAWGRSLFVLNICAFVVIGGLSILHWCGLFDDLSSLEQLKTLIRATGGWAYLVYVVLQFLNVVLLPLPGFLFMLAGIALFGAWETFWLTLFTTWVGVVICFWFGRTFGSRAVVWCVGAETLARYQKLLGAKGNLLFFIMQILPFFPDDMLCMIAGLTKMKFSFFVLTMAITKPIYIALVCFFGSGALIPFSGWGIPVWIAICIVFAVIFVLFCKYQNAIESWFAKVTRRKKTEPKDPTPA
ncbi:MAG: TVP38/TMEM64 family protein [Prevotella sp.]|nr:TVP38/TMEM64 family protein [Prevotella sp.]